MRTGNKGKICSVSHQQCERVNTIGQSNLFLCRKARKHSQFIVSPHQQFVTESNLILCNALITAPHRCHNKPPFGQTQKSAKKTFTLPQHRRRLDSFHLAKHPFSVVQRIYATTYLTGNRAEGSGEDTY
jgi:hypothetical protein